LQVSPGDCGNQGVKAEGLFDEGAQRLRSCPRPALVTAVSGYWKLAIPQRFWYF
jgi:hypothetical protein